MQPAAEKQCFRKEKFFKIFLLRQKLRRIKAEVAHLVEHDLAKVGVAGSSPVFRSKSSLDKEGIFFSINVYHDWDALVVELVDTQDLKSCGQQWPYRFNSDPGHFLERLFAESLFCLKYLLL